MFFEAWGRIFLANDNVQGIFADFRFMMFSIALMKELKSSSAGCSLMCLAIAENKLQHSCDIVNSGIELSKKFP